MTKEQKLRLLLKHRIPVTRTIKTSAGNGIE
jgi:hypothetical protein